MRRAGWIFPIVWVCLTGFAAVFAQTEGDMQQCPYCRHCGMDRQQFAQSRMLIQYDDGTSLGVCSIHCAAVDLAVNIDKSPQAVQVGDHATKKLIDAENAVWVLGGSKPGVMTKRAKWAFENKADAEKFISENGGDLTNFDGAMKASYEDMWVDTKMIRDKRKMKKMQGQKP